MPIDLELLPKIVSKSEEKKLKVFVNYLMYDIFSEKISFPIFKERMSVVNLIRKFDLFLVFKEISGKNKKYITIPRLIESYMGYKLNSPESSTEIKNFFAFVIYELITDYSDKMLGAITKTMKEFSTKNNQSRSSITRVQLFTGTKNNDIVGINLEYDEKFHSNFIAPGNTEKYDLKIDFKLKINEKFVNPEDLNGEEDMDYARDYITHIFGTHTSVIESIGFKTAFGKHYYAGKPTKGKQFLVGTTKSKFHYMKFGMDKLLNCISFKFKPAISNPNVNKKFEEYVEEEFQVIFPDEKVLASMPDGEKKDKIIRTPINDEKEDAEDDDDLKGDDLDEICHSDSEDGLSEDEEKDFKKLVSTVVDNDIRNELISNHERERLEELKKKKNQFHDISAPEVVQKKEKEKKVEVVKPKRFKKLSYDEFRVTSAKDITVGDLVDSPDIVNKFVDRINRYIKEELNEQVRLKEKVNSMKSDFYIKYLNRNKEVKDWEVYENQITIKEDPFELQKEYLAIIRSVDQELPVPPTPKNLHNTFVKGDQIPVMLWNSYTSFLTRKFSLINLREATVKLAIKTLENYENGATDQSFTLKDRIILLKHIIRLKNEKKLMAYNPKDLVDFKKEKKKKEKKEKIQNSKSMAVVKKDKKLIEKKESKKEVPYSEADVERALGKSIAEIKSNIEKEYHAVKAELGKYSKIVSKKYVLPDHQKFYKKYEELKKVKEWMNKLEAENAKESMKQDGSLDATKVKEEELEKRKKILDLNKNDKEKEKKEKEDKRLALIKEPVKTGELIKNCEDVKIYRKQQIPESGKFEDTLFEAKIDALCPWDENEGDFILPPNGMPEDVVDWDTYEWAEFGKVFKGKSYQVFLDKIEEGDIIQGGLSDCYFLSAVAAITKFPDLIRKLFLFQERSEEGCYAVKFRINGVWKYVLVDEKIPTSGGNRPDFVFTATNDTELWVVLLEKAWGKLCGNFARTCGGLPSEVFDCLTNSMTETIDVEIKNLHTIWAKMKLGKERNFIMCAGTGNSEELDYDEIGLMTGHAYTVLDSYEFNYSGVATRLVKLRNPWGSSEFSGDWSDNSPLWTEKLRKELNVTNVDDGIFFMRLDDFIKYYAIFQMCHIYPDFNHNYVSIPKEKTLQPVVTQMKLSADSKVFIQLHQKASRFVSKDGTYPPENSFLFVMILDEEFNFVKSAASSNSVESLEVDLFKGTFYIVTDVSYRYINKEKLHGYTLTAISKEKTEFYSTEENYYDVINAGICNYSKTSLELKPHPGTESLGGVYTTMYSKSNNNFPYIFFYIDNRTKCEAAANLSIKSTKDCEFLGDTESNVNKIVVAPETAKSLIIRKFYETSRFEFSTAISIIYSSEALKSITETKGKEDVLEKSGKLLSKVFNYDAGIGILVINKDKKALDIKLDFNLKNLVIDGADSESSISKNTKPGDSIFVHLKCIDPHSSFAYSFTFKFK